MGNHSTIFQASFQMLKHLCISTTVSFVLRVKRIPDTLNPCKPLFLNLSFQKGKTDGKINSEKNPEPISL